MSYVKSPFVQQVGFLPRNVLYVRNRQCRTGGNSQYKGISCRLFRGVKTLPLNSLRFVRAPREVMRDLNAEELDQ